MSEAFWVEVRMSDNVVHSKLFVLALLGRVEAPQIKVTDANLQLAWKENLVQLVRCCCHGGWSENGAGANEAVVPGTLALSECVKIFHSKDPVGQDYKILDMSHTVTSRHITLNDICHPQDNTWSRGHKSKEPPQPHCLPA